MNEIFQYSWRLFFVLIFMPALYWLVDFENKSKKDAYFNGKVIKATLKKAYCYDDSATLEYLGNRYYFPWSCNPCNAKEGDIVKVKYSEKYDVIIPMKFRYYQKLYIFFFAVFLFFHLLGVISLLIYFKGIRIGNE